MESVECAIINDCFEYNERKYDCSYAIRRDIKMILQEAETSHGDSFDKTYDKSTLRPDKIRLFVDEDNIPIYGMIIYLIDYKDEIWKRSACGGYYPFWEGKLFPHFFQESICW